MSAINPPIGDIALTDSRPHDAWMTTSDGTFIDIHSKLQSFDDVFRFFLRVEREFDRKSYCNGANAGGRWIYQIYSEEFITKLADLLQDVLLRTNSQRPVLEVMAGDGLLSHYLQPRLPRPIIPTDSKTSRDGIGFPKSVERIDAVEAIAKYKPSIVLMSWEPFYSDTSFYIIKTGIPIIWIGDPNSCAVGSKIHQTAHDRYVFPYLLGRNDDFINEEFRTEVRVFNGP